ncbi:hypothetical protein MVEN_01924700 [Mycena venus]|uniref:PEP-CTERM sorting domain-containing protein n=1 Tax=Mycena venus TaxID=2733690 RepID=A0A8H6XGH9_9AGAR|nr:hypothetical protein MVEN_01924700 [Mycena venus]
MFKPTVAALLATLSLSSLAYATMIPDLVFHNGQSITFDYHNSFVSAGNLFGMGVTRAGADIPATVTSFGWEGPVVLNIDDFAGITATYLLQYPFFQNGSLYTAQIFQYDTTTLEVVVPNVNETTFIWVNAPGQDV